MYFLSSLFNMRFTSVQKILAIAMVSILFANSSAMFPALLFAQEVAATPSAVSAPADSTGSAGTSGSTGGTPIVDPVSATPAAGGVGAATNSGSTPSPTTAPVAGASSSPAIVVTGNAVSTADAGTSANQNTTTVAASSTSTSTLPIDATISALASSTNEGTASSTMQVDASTGNNGASSNGGALIATGNALASANVINVLNTNIVDSQGFIYLLNQLSGGTINLGNLFGSLGTAGNAGACSLSGCAQAGVDFTSSASNTATISNAVVVRASSGDNSATSTGGTALIETGNAYAGANVINVANFTAIQSNYLLIGINNFGDLNGDIVLPNASFFANMFGNSIPLGGLSTANTNSANVTNAITTTADSGNNTASTTDGAIIQTGNATTQVGLTNQVNTNALGGKKVYILVRVLGDWAGQVFGLPSGVSWSQTPTGLEVFDNGSASGNATPSFGSLSAVNNNAVTINNNISVTALTGGNRIDATQGAIATGNAYAGANVINVANTTIVGENWIFAIFNIMGNWRGNLSFGQPDLWIGGSVSGRLSPGAISDYTFTVTNHGNADATHVKLKLDCDKNLLSFTDASSSEALWDIGTIATGQTIHVTRQGTIASGLSIGTIPLPLAATVTPLETDANVANNTEHMPLVIDNGYQGGGGAHVEITPDDDLRLTKTASKSKIAAPGSVDYTLRLENHGGPAYHSELFDTITGPDGTIVEQKRWWLGDIKAGEDITITYTAQFGTSTPAGTYTNSAQVKAIDRNPSISPFYGWFGPSNIATTTLEIEAAPPAVASSDLMCPAYIEHYIGRGLANDVNEVKKLQDFLREKAGFADLVSSGIYDDATYRAVVAFQNTNKDKILGPWGVTGGTGYVYYTTRKRINEIMCESKNKTQDLFPLDNNQQSEIQRYRTRLDELRRSGETPDTSKVGLVPKKHRDVVAEIRNNVPEPSTPKDADISSDALVGAAASAVGNNQSVLKNPFFFDIVQLIKNTLRVSMQ